MTRGSVQKKGVVAAAAAAAVAGMADMQGLREVQNIYIIHTLFSVKIHRGEFLQFKGKLAFNFQAL